MTKKNKIVSFFMAVVLCTSLLATTAFAAWTTLGVSLVRQAKSNWCWAASLEMCATYLGYTDYDQWDIVREVKGTSSEPYPNLTGGASDYKNGMEYATGNDYTATRTSTVLTLSQLNTSMNNSMPVILAIGTYNSSGSRTSGHAVVCYAVDTNSNKLRVRDPARDSYVEYYYPTLVSTEQTSRYDGTASISQK